jgi:hypothetical protein
MFDGNGKIVVHWCEGLHADYLRKQFMNLWPPHELTGNEKARVISAVNSILGASRSTVQANLSYSRRGAIASRTDTHGHAIWKDRGRGRQPSGRSPYLDEYV